MKKRKIWFWLMTVTSVIYILWRLIFTIPTEYGIVSLIAGITLFVAEFVSMLEAVIHYICMRSVEDPEMPVISVNQYPSVDVMIATHSEEADLLFKTINGCKHMEYPDKSKVHIYICDDGNRPEIAKLAEDMDVGYFGLAENKLAKAGNLNNAIGKTHSELIVTFDADMIPRSNFLMETTPYFLLPKMIKDKDTGKWRLRTEDEIDEKFKIGFIQTPQSFYNPDLFQFNFFAEKNIPNEQDYFFREVNLGRNTSNSAIYAGSNTVISREALEEVGGIRTGTITEDFATGIDIQAHGYTCYAIKKVLASGLAPDDFPNLLRQRQRWGRGCVQTLRGKSFWSIKMPFITKLSYFTCLLYWWTFMRRIIYILSPILYSVFGLMIVKTNIWGLLLIWLPSYIIYNHSLRMMSGKIRDQKWSNIVDTILCPYMIFPILAESLGIRMKKFAVTSKEKTVSRSSKLIYAIPHIVLLISTIIGMVFIGYQMFVGRTIFPIVVLFWLCMNFYFLAMSIFFMFGRINYRNSERFVAEMPVDFEANGYRIEGTTTDISEYGFAFKTDFPEFLENIETFHLRDGKWEATVKGHVVHVSSSHGQWKYSVELEELPMEDKKAYSQIVFDRYPTLASEIKTTALQDVCIFFKRKTSATVKSVRKYPRIPLDCSLKTIDGDKIEIIDYNYRYISTKEKMPKPIFDLKFGDVTLNMKEVPQSEDRKNNLYEVLNWEEVSDCQELKDALVRLTGAQSYDNESVHA